MFFAISTILTLISCLALIVLANRTSHFDRRDDLHAKQASHTRKAPRLGGAAIIVSVVMCIALLPTQEARETAALIGLSAIPVFAAGLLEDLGFGVSPKRRLMAAAVSAAFAIILTGTWIRAAGLPGVDSVLAILPIGVIVTILWSSGVCHATNLIDGMNGLAGGFSALAALGLAGLSWSVGDTAIAYTALLLSAAILGFLALNWPSGRIFLGDAGAYTIGHLLAWCGIVLAWRNPEVTGASIALVFFWPIMDTFFTMLRRKLSGKAIDQPDRMHLHQVVMRWLEIGGVGRQRRHVSNPLTTALLLPLISMPIIAAIVLSNHGVAAAMAWAAFAAAFVASYRIGAKWAKGRHSTSLDLRPVRTTPVGNDLFIPHDQPTMSAPVVIDVNPNLRLVRRSNYSHWTAYSRDISGVWHRVERSFPTRDGATRMAYRIQRGERMRSMSARWRSEGRSVGINTTEEGKIFR